MKRYTLLLFLAALASCAPTQQVIQVSSNKVPIKDNHPTSENDALIVTYDFWNYKGQMKFTVYNKLDVPVYIDWKNAGFIVNDRGLHYYVDGSESHTTGGNSFYYYYGWNSVGASKTTTVRTERVYTLLPHSKMTKVQYALFVGDLLSTPTLNKFKTEQGRTTITGFSTDYTEQNTPEKFRNFFMYSTKEDMKDARQWDDEFYFSKVFTVRRNSVPKLAAYNRFYITNERLMFVVGKEY